MHPRALVFLAAAMLLVGASPAQAQRPAGASRFDVAFFLGLSSNPADKDVERSMRLSGYDDDGVIVIQRYPWSSDYGEFPWTLVVGHRVRGPWAVALALGDGSLGETNGFRATGGFSGESVHVTYGAAFVAAQAVLRPNGVLDLGLGPALYRTRAACSSACEGEQSATKAGALAGATVRLPLFGRLGAAATGQYRLVGSSDVGPFTTSSGGTIGRTSAAYSHAYGAIGLTLAF